MAVDKSYGSGKSRSAANSSARRRVAADQMTKSKKSPAEKIKAGRAKMAASPLGQLADTVLGFALPVGKVKAAAMGLRTAGQAGNRLKFLAAEALEGRLAAKTVGKKIGSTFSYWDNAPRNLANVKRMTSEPIFPKLNKYDYESVSNVKREIADGAKYLNKKLKGK